MGLWLWSMMLYIIIPTAPVKSPLFVKSSLKVGPKTSRKEPPGSVMARDSQSITGRGFQIVLSTVEVSRKKHSSSFRRLKFCEFAPPARAPCANSQNFKRRNEGDDCFCETSLDKTIWNPRPVVGSLSRAVADRVVLSYLFLFWALL